MHPAPTPTLAPNTANSQAPVFPGRWALAASIIYLIWHFLYRLALAGNQLYPFDGPANDGPFQMHNPLVRMDHGETVGTGFSFFHGPAIPALHYPLHWLGGRTIHASELARHLVSIVGFHAAYLAIFWAWTRSLRQAVVPWALAVMASDAWDMWQLAECDNSLYGLRGIMPVLAAAAALSPLGPKWRAATAGLLLGLSLLLGTELGLAACLASLAVTLLACLGAASRAEALQGLLIAPVAIFCGLCMPLLVLGGLPALTDFVRFNLAIVPADQFWYFGVPPNPFIHSFQQFLAIEYVRTTLLVAVVAAVALLAWRARSPGSITPHVMLAILIFGCISTYALMGVLNPVYITTLRRSLLIILIVLGWKASRLLASQSSQAGTIVGAALPALLLAALFFWPTRHRYEGALKLPKVASGLKNLVMAVGNLPGGTLSPRLRQDLDQVLDEVEQALPDPGSRQGNIWSTFAGLPETTLGVLHPDCDYIIHALGPRRDRYTARFTECKPEVVIIPGLSQFSYENWVRDSNWPFYELVYLNYTTRRSTSSHQILRRQPDWKGPGDWQGESLPDDSGTITLPPGQAGKILSLDVEYSTQSRWGWLPMVGKLPRWLVFRQNGLEKTPVSLPPGETSWRFSSRALPGQVVTLNPVTASPWGGKLTLTKARWRWINAENLKD